MVLEPIPVPEALPGEPAVRERARRDALSVIAVTGLGAVGFAAGILGFKYAMSRFAKLRSAKTGESLETARRYVDENFFSDPKLIREFSEFMKGNKLLIYLPAAASILLPLAWSARKRAAGRSAKDASDEPAHDGRNPRVAFPGAGPGAGLVEEPPPPPPPEEADWRRRADAESRTSEARAR